MHCLRSSGKTLLSVLQSWLKSKGDYAFAVRASRIWKALPQISCAPFHITPQNTLLLTPDFKAFIFVLLHFYSFSIHCFIYSVVFISVFATATVIPACHSFTVLIYCMYCMQCWSSLLKKVIYYTLHITLKNSNALHYMITP